MKNLTWQIPEQLFVAQVLINKVKSKCCGIKDINDFHRQNSLAALKGEQYMLLHPYSREQKLAQINSLRQNTVSKENSNLERSKKKVEFTKRV